MGIFLSELRSRASGRASTTIRVAEHSLPNAGMDDYWVGGVAPDFGAEAPERRPTDGENSRVGRIICDGVAWYACCEACGRRPRIGSADFRI